MIKLFSSGVYLLELLWIIGAKFLTILALCNKFYIIYKVILIYKENYKTRGAKNYGSIRCRRSKKMSSM